MLYTAVLKPWNTEESVMAMAAPRKLGAIMRIAGMPMLSMVSLALNRRKSGPGIFKGTIL